MQWLVREERSVRQLLLSQRPQSFSVHPVTFLQLIHTLHPPPKLAKEMNLRQLTPTACHCPRAGSPFALPAKLRGYLPCIKTVGRMAS